MVCSGINASIFVASSRRSKNCAYQMHLVYSAMLQLYGVLVLG